jgi:predicted RND superfamily exporter protein
MKQMVSWIARQSARHPWLVLTLTLVISLFSAYCASRLPVYTSRQALLPQDTEVARRLNSFLEKFGSASDLIVAVEGAERPELERFATELAQRLNNKPEIAHATERLDRSFFIQHAYLLIPQTQFGQLDALLTGAEAKKPPETLASALKKARDAIVNPLPASSVDLSKATKMLTGTQA